MRGRHTNALDRLLLQILQLLHTPIRGKTGAKTEIAVSATRLQVAAGAQLRQSLQWCKRATGARATAEQGGWDGSTPAYRPAWLQLAAEIRTFVRRRELAMAHKRLTLARSDDGCEGVAVVVHE